MENELAFDDTIQISSENSILEGRLVIPENSHTLIIFVNDARKSQEDSRGIYLSEILQKEGFATLLVDLLTSQEISSQSHMHDVLHLTERILNVCRWAAQNPQTEALNAGLFGFNTGAAAAIETVSRYGNQVNAVVSLGGRPDLVMDDLKKINVPLLLIAGNEDHANVVFHEKVLPYLNAESKIEIIQDSGKGFYARETLDKVAILSKDWFVRHS